MTVVALLWPRLICHNEPACFSYLCTAALSQKPRCLTAPRTTPSRTWQKISGHSKGKSRFRTRVVLNTDVIAAAAPKIKKRVLAVSFMCSRWPDGDGVMELHGTTVCGPRETACGLTEIACGPKATTRTPKAGVCGPEATACGLDAAVKSTQTEGRGLQ